MTSESARALEAFNSIPGDSESKVDYQPVNNNYLPVGKEYYELAVDITVHLPDGTQFQFRESVEKDERDDYDLDEAAAMLDKATEVMARRLG